MFDAITKKGVIADWREPDVIRVAPVPLYLKNTSSFLKGKELTSINIRKGHCVLKEEISPISDVRGSDKYKKLLLKQLYFAHFIKLFPEIISIADIK